MFAQSGKAALAYDVVEGSGSLVDVLLIHAGVTDRRSWQPLISELVAHRRVVSYDARGYGETTYEAESHSEAADALAVMDAAELQRAAVVGCSVGGARAVNLTLAHPDRVAALVLIGAAVNGAPYADADEPELEALFAQAEAAEKAGDIETANQLEANIWLDGPTASRGRVTGAARELFLEMNGKALAAPPAGDDTDPGDAWDRLGEIGVPTLVLVGDLDVADIQDIEPRVAGRIPGAKFVELPGVAHLPQLEADPACLAEIRAFLAAVPTAD